MAPIVYGIILTLIGIILLWWVSTLPLQMAVMLGLVAYIPLLMGLWITVSQPKKWVSNS